MTTLTKNQVAELRRLDVVERQGGMFKDIAAQDMDGRSMKVLRRLGLVQGHTLIRLTDAGRAEVQARRGTK